MATSRTKSCVVTVGITLITIVNCAQNAAAQQAIYGDSDSFRGIEEQARRRAKAEAALDSNAMHNKLVAEGNRIRSESSAQWETLSSAYRSVFLRDMKGLRENSGLPPYLQRQFFEVVRLDIEGFNAQEQELIDFNQAKIEYATLMIQKENLQLLRDAQRHEAIARQNKLIQEKSGQYTTTLEKLRTSRAKAAQISEQRNLAVKSYNQNFTNWQNASNSVSRSPSSSNSYGSGGDDYDLAGALRDRLRELNSGLGH